MYVHKLCINAHDVGRFTLYDGRTDAFGGSWLRRAVRHHTCSMAVLMHLSVHCQPADEALGSSAGMGRKRPVRRTTRHAVKGQPEFVAICNGSLSMAQLES